MPSGIYERKHAFQWSIGDNIHGRTVIGKWRAANGQSCPVVRCNSCGKTSKRNLWSLRRQACRHRALRRTKSVVLFGVQLTVAELAQIYGLQKQTIFARLRKGVTGDALVERSQKGGVQRPWQNAEWQRKRRTKTQRKSGAK